MNEGAAKYRYGIGTLHVRALMARTGAFSNRAIVAEKWVCVTVEKYDQSENRIFVVTLANMFVDLI